MHYVEQNINFVIVFVVLVQAYSSLIAEDNLWLSRRVWEGTLLATKTSPGGGPLLATKTGPGGTTFNLDHFWHDRARFMNTTIVRHCIQLPTYSCTR